MDKRIALGADWGQPLIDRLSAALPGWTVLPGAHGDRGLARSASVLVPVAMPVDRDLLAGSKIRLVHQFGVGLDNVDLAAARELGIAVANAPSDRSGMAASVAEGAVHLVLSCARLPCHSAQSLAAGLWNWKAPLNLGLAGKTAGLVGLGNIGMTIARRLSAFDMRLIGVRRSPSRASGFDWVGGMDRMADLMAEADFVVVSAPLNPETRGLIGKVLLAKAKPGASLVNVGRGGVVDEVALIEALDEGRMHAAGLDTVSVEPLPADSPLLAHPRIVLTPHTAGVTETAFDGVAAILAGNVTRLEAGEELCSRVA